VYIQTRAVGSLNHRSYYSPMQLTSELRFIAGQLLADPGLSRRRNRAVWRVACRARAAVTPTARAVHGRPVDTYRFHHLPIKSATRRHWSTTLSEPCRESLDKTAISRRSSCFSCWTYLRTSVRVARNEVILRNRLN